MSCWPVVALLGIALGLSGATHAATEALAPAKQFKPKTRYDRLIASLPERSIQENEEFARIAVEQMLFEHDAALFALQENTPKDTRALRKRFTWGRATSEYLKRLDHVSSLMASGESGIEVERTPAGEIYIYVDDQPVVVTSLDLKRPEVLQHGILDAFCIQFDCADLEEPEPPEPEPLPERPQNKVRAGWSFGDGMASTYRTRDGLSFMFSDLRDRARKQQLCEQIASELRAISELLGRARSAGYPIDWQSLELQEQPGEEGQRLVFNRQGTFVRTAAPTLIVARDVLDMGRPWLEARMEGKLIPLAFPRTDLFLGSLLK